MSCRMSVKKFKGILCNSSGEIYSWKNASSDFTTGLLRNHSIWDILKENPNVVAVQIPSGTSKETPEGIYFEISEKNPNSVQNFFKKLELLNQSLKHLWRNFSRKP